MESCLNPEIENGITDEKFGDSVSSNSSTSSEADLFEEVDSVNGPLQDVSSLLQQLPIKRGLSEHYNGKSQSFTCLSNVACLEDLAKPENPYNKKLKSCKSYGGLWESQSPKKTSRGSCSKLHGRRNSSFIGSRLQPPIHSPHGSTSTSRFANQTTLFASRLYGF